MAIGFLYVLNVGKQLVKKTHFMFMVELGNQRKSNFKQLGVSGKFWGVGFRPQNFPRRSEELGVFYFNLIKS